MTGCLPNGAIGIIDGHSKKRWEKEFGNDPMAMAAFVAAEGRTPAVQIWSEFRAMPAQVVIDTIADYQAAGKDIPVDAPQDDGNEE